MDSGDQPHPNWKALATAHLKWKVFVQAKPETKSDPGREKSTFSNPISGDDAKQFYEDLLQCDAVQGTSDDDDEAPDIEFVGAGSSRRNEKTQSNNKASPQTIHKAMRHAQNNEEEELRKMLQNGLSVNAKDEYGWSLLMVAACGGAQGVVRTLLDRKAKTGLRDSKGNTAVYLAMTKGHHHIVEMLIKANKKKGEDSNNSKETASSSGNSGRVEEFFCDVCNTTIKTSTHIQHETSIVHQFNVGSGSQKTIYGIPPSNKGFQILVNQGWDSEKGLGPDSSGVKFPVKTALKKDRKGLGATVKTNLRVTHFGPGDVTAVKRTHIHGERIERKSTISRRERNRQISKEKRRERDIRRALSEPDY